MSARNSVYGPNYVDVVVDVPAVGDRKFTYRVPQAHVLPYGAKVHVPFGRKKVDGYVVGHVTEHPNFPVKDVAAVYDLDFLPPEHLLSLGKRLKDYYLASTASFWTYLWPPLVSRKRLKPGVEIKAPQRKVSSYGKTNADSAGETVFIQGPAYSRWGAYLEAIEQTLNAGQGVIVMVPEIRKTDAAKDALSPLCGGLSLVHSDLTGANRRTQWQRLLTGQATVALGTRTAVFSPVQNLGLIIIDEEESLFYKAEEFPRYNAVTVARARANLENCRVMLGSFVPSVRAHYYISTGKLKALKQPSRCPDVDVAHQTVSLLGRSRRVVITKEMHLALREVFNNGERAILFLNRRGTSSSLMCTDCGNTVMCPRCSVSLAYHARDLELVCHTCGYRQPAPAQCPVCRGYTWKPLGYGIDRVVSEFMKRFPGIPVLQLDQDSESPEKVIEEFRSLSPSCLLSTQMVLGFEMPPVMLLGVLSCDNLLSFPDYRAPEQVFRLLMDLLHLLESSKGNPQKVFIVQSLNPQHHAIKGAEDPDNFYVLESNNRAALCYPPFGALFKIEFSGKDHDKVKNISEQFAKKAEDYSESVQVLGPSPSPKPKVRGRYRWIIMLKSAKRDVLSKLMKTVLPEVSHRQVRVSVDTEEPFSIG